MEQSTEALVEQSLRWLRQNDFPLQSFPTIPAGATVFLEESDFPSTSAVLFALLAKGCQVVLTSPHWGEIKRAEVHQQVNPDFFICGSEITQHKAPSSDLPERTPTISIATGGTTGGTKLAIHTLQSLFTAAQGFTQHYKVDTVSSLLQLPISHISGLMQLIRAIHSGGKIYTKPDSPYPEGIFISYVPTQLERILRTNDAAELARLRQARAILLGGAAASPQLLQQARDLRLPLSPCYGMTETAALVCGLLPDEFLAGKTGVGKALPHVEISRDETTGRIDVKSRSLFHNYWGHSPRQGEYWSTGDRGLLDNEGYVTIQGRLDSLINTGGEKVDPEHVAKTFTTIKGVREALVFGLPDAEWGQKVVAICAVDSQTPEQLRQHLRPGLSRHELPKQIVTVAEIPRMPTGKPDWERIHKLFTP